MRNHRLLRFHLKSTATFQMAAAQKLGDDLNRSQPKFAAKTVANEKDSFESHVGHCRDLGPGPALTGQASIV